MRDWVPRLSVAQPDHRYCRLLRARHDTCSQYRSMALVSGNYDVALWPSAIWITFGSVWFYSAYKPDFDVAFGSWSCKNALAAALTPGDRGAVVVCGDFPQFCGFSFWMHF